MLPGERLAVQVEGDIVRRAYLKPGGFTVNDMRIVFRLGEGGEQRGQDLIARENAQLQQAVINERVRA